MTTSATTDLTAAEALERRIATLKQGRTWAVYQEARGHILRWLDAARIASGSAAPSAYWAEELAGFEYLFDASPLLLDTLRHQTYHVTGLKVYDYRTGKAEAREAMAAKIALLEKAAGGRALLVPEAPDLGGFGHEIDGALYNIDTLKFWEVMIALDRGEVLSTLRGSEGRPVVWEIGAGWGGFARVFKTHVPNSTYVIVDLPQTMLFSTVYLGTLFPDARVHYLDIENPLPAEKWSEFDFVFVPHIAVDKIAAPRLDLALNMVSFQEMTTDQVRGYVNAAADAGARFLYSLNRERSPYNPTLTAVSELIAERFWPHELSILDLPYTRMPDLKAEAKAAREAAKKGKDKKKAKAPDTGPEAVGKSFKRVAYRHIVGWPRSVGQ